MPKVYVGTAIRACSDSSSVLLWTDAQFTATFGSSGRPFVGVSNGDSAAASVHVEDATYVPGKGWHATFSGGHVGNIRINYVVVSP